MTYVVSRLCIDCLDTKCAEVCPVDCFYEYTGDDKEKNPNMLYINPDECVDCELCEPECPWEAIYPEDALPETFEEDLEINARTVSDPDDFEVVEPEDHDPPTPEQVLENKKRWGLAV